MADDFGFVPDQKEDFGFVADKSSSPQSSVGRIVNLLKNIASTTATAPLQIPKILPFQTAPEVGKAVVAADKNYPAENLLPIVGATAGAAVGSAATLPSGAGVLFGAPIGATIGGQVGSTAQKYISTLRGNQPVPKTPEEAVKETSLEGFKMGAYELGSSALLKGLEATGATGLARKGFGQLKEFLLNGTKPVEQSVVRETIAPYLKAPAADSSEAKNFVGEILDKKGIKINDSGGSSATQKLSEQQLKNLQDAGLSSDDIEKIAAQTKGVEGNVADIAKSVKPKLTSELQTPNVKDYQGLANIYQDLNKPDLTYGQLKQMQSTVGDSANFDSSERTGLEKIYGKIYSKIGDLLDKTAEDGGFSKAHDFAQTEGSKFYQNRFLSNAFSESRSFGANDPSIDYGKLASKLNSLSDKEIEMRFGDNAKYIQTLRDLANHGAKLEKSAIYTRLSSRGTPAASVKVGSIFDKLNAKENIAKILNRNLGSDASKFTPSLYPGSNAVNVAAKVGAKTAGSNYFKLKDIIGTPQDENQP